MRRLIWLSFVILLGALGAAKWVSVRLNTPFKGYPTAEQFVDIVPGSSTRKIGDQLVASGVVSDRLSYRVALWLADSSRLLKAGEYRFDRPMTAREVIDVVVRGDVYERPLTFPEGLTIREMAGMVEAKGFGSRSDFETAARDVSLLAGLDPQAPDLEGYLFPDTYALSRHSSASRLVRLMVDRFGRAFPEALHQKAREKGWSVRQVVTLASIIEKETARAEERPIVASVYLNRLRIGMGLQCDPTVIYALHRAGRFSGNLTRDDLLFDSPYNTYKYAGLPPGPIAAPGKASLEAVLEPAETGYLYFVSRNDGSHVFARTLEEHNRNVREFQIQYFREKRLRDSQSSSHP